MYAKIRNASVIQLRFSRFNHSMQKEKKHNKETLFKSL